VPKTSPLNVAVVERRFSTVGAVYDHSCPNYELPMD